MVSSSDNRLRYSDIDMIGLAGASIGALATVATAFVVLRPSRIQSGENLSATEAFGVAGWLLFGAWLLVAVLCVAPGRTTFTRAWLAIARALLAGAIIPVSLQLTASVAQDHALDQGDWARTSLGIGFWLCVLGVYLVASSAAAEIKAITGKILAWAVAPAATGTLILSGALDSLSIMIEYENFREPFWQHLTQHLGYTIGASGVALAWGVALGIWASKRRYAEAGVFGALNIAQVMPALAFIGLMMVPLGWLRESVPFAAALGIGGIGWAPVFIVLLLYALYPITRKTFTALKALDGGITDAARGMGVGPWRRVLMIELPLVAPVVLAGVRVALVQTAAGAIVAALVGGGGLGRIVFFGLEQTAEDLVLLGVIAIVGLGLSFDIVLRAVCAILEQRGGLRADGLAEGRP